MTSPQRLPASLTPLDMALDALLKGVEPVAPAELPLREALRCIAAEMPPLEAIRHATSPPSTATPSARAIWSARPPIRRCRCRRRRYGSRLASLSPMAAIACWIPIRSTFPVRCRRCWRKRSRGRAYGGPATISPRKSCRRGGAARAAARSPDPRAAGVDAIEGAPSAPAHCQYSGRHGDGGSHRRECTNGGSRNRHRSRPPGAMPHRLPLLSVILRATCF